MHAPCILLSSSIGLINLIRLHHIGEFKMRNITLDAVVAFLYGYEFSRDNTRVVHCNEEGISTLVLHGHSIAKRCMLTGDVSIRHAGYTTNTTKERLNGVLTYLDAPLIYQRNYIWYWRDGEQFPDGWVVV